MKKVFPHPFISLFVVSIWLLLSGVSPGRFLCGLVVSFVAGLGMSRLSLEKNRICNWHLFPELFLYVIVDIIRSNLSVMYIILFRAGNRSQSGFIVIPLDLQNRAGLAFLACILTATPGTAWISYDSKSNALTLHVLDLASANEIYWRNIIKNRYERLLLEIFE